MNAKSNVMVGETGLRHGVLLLIVALALLSAMDIVSKYLTSFYSIHFILWVRYLLHTLLVTLTFAPRLGRGLLHTRRPGVQILRGVLLSVSSMAFVTAIKYRPIAESTAISFVYPLLVTLLAVVFLKEKMDTGRWIAIFVAFAGVLVIIRPGTGFAWVSLLPLSNAMLFAVYQVLTRQFAGRESVAASIFYPGIIGTILFSLTLPHSWTLPHDAWHLGLLVLAGLLGGTGHLIMIKAYAAAPASYLAPFSYTQLIWSTLGAYLVFGHFPDHWTLLGIAILVASGLYCAQRKPPKSET